jgi:hypothetical protein
MVRDHIRGEVRETFLGALVVSIDAVYHVLKKLRAEYNRQVVISGEDVHPHICRDASHVQGR